MSEITWTDAFIRLGEIDPWVHNPRKSNKQTAAELNNTLNKFGQPQPLVLGPCVDGRYPLYDGHQRYFAWKAKHGASFEAKATISSRPLTEDERKEYVIKFHASAVGGWDADALSSWDAGLIESWGVDMPLVNGWERDISTFKELLKSEQADGADAANEEIPEQYAIMITCQDEQEQTQLLEKFIEEGLQCRALIS
jgi:hypothetical protein